MPKKAVSDEAFIAMCKLVIQCKGDPDQLHIAEYMLCDAAMDRRREKITANLERMANAGE